LGIGGYFDYAPNDDTFPLSYYLWDDFRFEIVQEDEPITQKTVLATLGNGYTTESAVTVGDGPTAEADSRIRAQDAGGTWHNLTSDWGVGSGGTLSLSELRARESLRQRRKKVETRTVTFQLRNGQDIHPHEIIEWDGALWDIGYMRRQAGGRNIGRVTVELRKLEDFGTGGIEYQYAQASEPTRRGTVNVIAGGLNDNGSGPDGTLDWDNVVDKAELVNTLNGRQGHTEVLESDVTGALGYDPQSEVESLARHGATRNALTHTSEKVASGDVSTLPVEAQPGDPVLQSGDPIALIDSATGRPARAQVTTDVASGDTAIDVAAPDGTTLSLDEPLEAESGVYFGHRALLSALPASDVPLVSDMVSLPAAEVDAGEIVGVAEEGRGGRFLYNPDAAAANDGTTFEASVLSGRFERQYEGPVRAEWFRTNPGNPNADLADLRRLLEHCCVYGKDVLIGHTETPYVLSGAPGLVGHRVHDGIPLGQTHLKAVGCGDDVPQGRTDRDRPEKRFVTPQSAYRPIDVPIPPPSFCYF
jgi:hypothetical protein